MDNIKSIIFNTKDISKLKELKEGIDNAIIEQENHISMINTANDLSSKNFGFIKEAFEMMSPSLYNTTEGKKLIKKYISEIKDNDSLKEIYHIYENIYHAPKDIDIDFMINKSFVNPVSVKQFNEGVANIGKILSEAYMVLNGKFDISSVNVNEKLNESLNYLATTSEKRNNLTKRSSCVHDVRSYLLENAGKNVRIIPTATGSDADAILESFQSKYEEENGLDVVKEILGAKDKSVIFENYKKICIEAISKEIEENPTDINIDRLSNLLESISHKEYNENTIGTDIANFIEITELINE